MRLLELHNALCSHHHYIFMAVANSDQGISESRKKRNVRKEASSLKRLTPPVAAPSLRPLHHRENQKVQSVIKRCHAHTTHPSVWKTAISGGQKFGFKKSFTIDVQRCIHSSELYIKLNQF